MSSSEPRPESDAGAEDATTIYRKSDAADDAADALDAPAVDPKPKRARLASSPPVSLAWTIVAHVIGATALGLLESARLGSAGIALAILPRFK